MILEYNLFIVHTISLNMDTQKSTNLNDTIDTIVRYLHTKEIPVSKEELINLFNKPVKRKKKEPKKLEYFMA